MEINDRSIAVVGFPKQGKTVLRQQLEQAQPDHFFQFIETPGIFMLGRNTLEEGEAYDFLLGRSLELAAPHGIVAIADSGDLERQLYLVFQLIDLRLPFLLCLTGEERARAAGLYVSAERLERELGVKVATLEHGVDKAAEVVASWRNEDVSNVKRQPAHWRPSQALADAYQHLDSQWIHRHLPLYTGARLVEGLRLLTVPRAAEEYESHPAYKALLRNLDEARTMLENRNEKWTMAEVIQRTRWIGQVVQASVKKEQHTPPPAQARKWWQIF